MKGVSSLFSKLTLSSPATVSNASQGDSKDKKKTTETTSEKYGSLSAKVRPGKSEKGEKSVGRKVTANSSQASLNKTALPQTTPTWNDTETYTQSVWETYTETSQQEEEESWESSNSSFTDTSSSTLPPSAMFDRTKKSKLALQRLDYELRVNGRTPEELLFRQIRGMCYDIFADNIMRHSISMKEVDPISRICFTPEECAAVLAYLAKQGRICIDNDHPNYIFLPVPPDIKAQDAKPRSASGSSSNLKSSQVKNQSSVPEFFAKMGPAERRFYERDAAAVLLHYIVEASLYIPLSTTKTAEKNVRCFTIPRAMIDEAARDADPGIGIHPYLIPKAVDLLMKSELYAPRSAHDIDLHFKGTNEQFGRIMQKFSHTYQF